jgi:predicted transcriptional regulator
VTDRTREIAERVAREWMEKIGPWKEREDTMREIAVVKLTDAIEAAIREAEQGRWVSPEEVRAADSSERFAMYGWDGSRTWAFILAGGRSAPSGDLRRLRGGYRLPAPPEEPKP